ncbi:MAG: response regulator [Gemmataceae bacterium]
MSDAAPFTVLVVDDDPDARASLRDVLELDGYAVEEAGTAAATLARADWGRYGAVLLDRRLPDGSAEELLPALRRLAPDAAVLVVTGWADVAATITAFRLGAADYVLKPVRPDELRARIGRIADHHRDRAALRASQALAHGILDSLSANIAVLDRAGTIIAVNTAWQAFARRRPGGPVRCGLGANYLAVCRQVTGPGDDHALRVERGLEAILSGASDRFAVEFPCDLDAGRVWFSLIATPLGPDRRGVVIAHQDVTAQKRTEGELRAKTEELRAATQQLWQAARLAGVGELAASIAHELNNPLGTVSLRVEGVLAQTHRTTPAAGRWRWSSRRSSGWPGWWPTCSSSAAPAGTRCPPWTCARRWPRRSS